MFDTDLIWWVLPVLLSAVLLSMCIAAASIRISRFIAKRYLINFRLTILSTITIFAIMGTTLAVAALTVVTGISTGFQAEFQRKVLGVNAHVLVLKYLDFPEYRRVMEQVSEIPGVAGVNPFIIHPMMVVHGPRIAGVLLKGVDPELMPTVLDLPQHIVDGTYTDLRLPGRRPPSGRTSGWGDPFERERDRSSPLEDLMDQALPEEDDDVDEEGVAGVAPRRGERRDTPQEVIDNAVADALEVDNSQPAEQVGVPGVVPLGGDGEEATGSELDEAIAEALGVETSAPEPLQQPEELPGIVLGRTLANELDAHVGDTVRIVTPLSGLDVSFFSPDSHGPRSREFRVIGLFYSGFEEYDTRLVYVDLFEAQEFFDRGDVVNGVELRLDDPQDARDIARSIAETLGGSPYRVIDWEQLNHNLFTALRIQKLALTVVVSLLVVVSGLLIAATLVMMIFEKKREIAILKAMGVSNAAIMSVFLLVGSTVGVIGTTMGMALGYGLCKFLIAYGWPLDPEVYLIDHLPVEIIPLDYAWVSTIALLICVVSTVFPSWITAAKMKPVDGLRYE